MSKLKLTTIIVAINCLLIVAQFTLATTRATDGDRLQQLTTKLTSIEAENHNLQLAIYNKSSLTSIFDAAASANLVPARTTAWTPLPVALAP